MGFSWQGYWSGLPFPSTGDHPDPGIEPGSPTLQSLYHLSHQGGLTYNRDILIYNIIIGIFKRMMKEAFTLQ